MTIIGSCDHNICRLRIYTETHLCQLYGHIFNIYPYIYNCIHHIYVIGQFIIEGDGETLLGLPVDG